MSIPWSVEPRPDTGQYNGRMGMWLFLVAEAMFMGALFSSLVFLRTAGEDWSSAVDTLSPWGAFVSVLLIEAAAIAITIAWKRAALGALAANLFLAAAGIAVLTWDQSTVAAASAGTAYAMVHVLNGVTRLHMLGALITGLWFLIGNAALRRAAPQRFKNRLECLGLFWHFIGISWLITFVLLYLM